MHWNAQHFECFSAQAADRQSVCFSQVETLAKQALHDPVEIQVGGRSVVNKDITQLIEIRPEADRFLRLLEILGEFYENGKILIFVASQDLCDNLFRDLLKVTSTWTLLLTSDLLAGQMSAMRASAAIPASRSHAEVSCSLLHA